MAKKPERQLFSAYLCFYGGRVHRAYLHINMGAAIIWCPKHGILCSHTNRLGIKNTERKQMTSEQYDKFVKALKKARWYK